VYEALLFLILSGVIKSIRLLIYNPAPTQLSIIMTTTTLLKVLTSESNIPQLLSSLPKEMRKEWCQEYLDAIQQDKNRRERERAARWDIPRNIDITQYGFTSFEEADSIWPFETRDGSWGPDTNVTSWLRECRKSFLKRTTKNGMK